MISPPQFSHVGKAKIENLWAPSYKSVMWKSDVGFVYNQSVRLVTLFPAVMQHEAVFRSHWTFYSQLEQHMELDTIYQNEDLNYFFDEVY